MTSLNNLSINTLDKAYNVFSTNINIKKSNENNNVQINDLNEKSIDDNINYENTLNFADETESINSQEKLKNILDNVKRNIKSNDLSNIHKINISNDVMNLLN